MPIDDFDIANFLSKKRGTSLESEYLDVKKNLVLKPFDPCSLMPGSISKLDTAGLSTNEKVRFLEKQGHSYESALIKVKMPKIT